MDYFILLRNIVLLFICGWISYTDIKRYEIDHTPLIVGSLFAITFNLFGLNTISFFDGLISALVLFVIFFILTFFSMGGGDLKFMTMVALFIGLGQGLTAFFVGIFVSAIYALLLLLVKRDKKYLKSKVAMGPFFAIGVVFSLYFYNYVLQFISNNVITF